MAALKRTKFKPLDQKRVKEGAARTNSKFDGIFKQDTTVLKMKVGVNNLRIVRGVDDSYWGETIYVHSYIGAKSSTYLCPKLMGKSKTCPVCDAASDATAAGDKEEAKALMAKERVICWCVDRDAEKEGLKIWDMSFTQQHEVDAVCDTKRGVLDISHAEAGFDLSIQRQGTGKMTRYGGLQIDRESTPLSENSRQQDTWLEEIEKKPLLSLLRYYDEKYLSDILSGKVEEKDEDEGKADAKERDEEEVEEEAPKRRRGRDEELEDPDERPARRGTRSEKPAWEDEAEEDARTSRRSRKDKDEEKADSDNEAGEARRWRRSQQDDAEDDRKPVSRRARSEEEEDEPDERPARRGRGRDEEDEERSTRSSRTRSRDPEPEEEDERPARRTRGTRDEPEEEEDERPASRKRERVSSKDEDEADERPRARASRRDGEDDDEPRSRRR